MTRYRRKTLMDMKLFPENPLKYVAKQNKVTQKKISFLTGISTRQISRYFNGYDYLEGIDERRIRLAIQFYTKDTPVRKKREIFEYFFPKIQDC